MSDKKIKTRWNIVCACNLFGQQQDPAVSLSVSQSVIPNFESEAFDQSTRPARTTLNPKLKSAKHSTVTPNPEVVETLNPKP